MADDRWLTPELQACAIALASDSAIQDWESLYLGFDLGTTNLVLVAVNEKGQPVSAVLEPSVSAVQDGVVVDYWAAVQGMKKCKELLSRKLGVSELVGVGAAAYPPGISVKTAKVCGNVVETLGFDCKGLYEEPSAAAAALGMTDGAIVDIGGGTTGISVLQEGRVVFTADEPTGGTHMTLVLSGAMNCSFEQAERMKRDKESQKRFVPLLKPVLEKMATIALNQLETSGYFGKVPIVLVGGGADLPGAEEIMSQVIGQPVSMAPHPLLVTPAGIALSLWRDCHESN
jgi:ethanolamine utilization protein EutJ